MNSALGRSSKKACNTVIYSIFAIGLTLVMTLTFAWTDPSPLSPEETFMVTLDPGHGGRDAGAMGPTGHLEKTVCLELARKLAARLESRCRVTLTRNDDYHVELQQRTAIANQAEAGLLVSLHTGAAYVHSIQGVTIFYHVPPSDRQPAGDNNEQQLWDRTQARHQTASLSLASTLKLHLDKMPEAPPCRIQGAPLPLLKGADMPAILIEIGYITHPATEAKLATPGELEQLSEQLFNGVQEFISGFRRRNSPYRPAWPDRDADQQDRSAQRNPALHGGIQRLPY